MTYPINRALHENPQTNSVLRGIFVIETVRRWTRFAGYVFSTLCVVVLFAFSGVAQQNNTIITVAGGGAPTSNPLAADLPAPNAVVDDLNGNVYIAPPASYYIYLWNKSSNTLSVFAGSGIQGGTGDGGPATSATLLGPAALALDSAGNLYIADANKIRCVAAVNGACGVSAGQINTISGQRKACEKSYDPCGDGGPASGASYNLPQGLFADNSGNLFIADTEDHRIRLISNGTVSTVAGNGQVCPGGTGQICGDGGSATQALLNLPRGVVLDAKGNIYIADSRDQRIRAVSGGTINTLAGDGKVCSNSQSACGDGGSLSQAEFHTPCGLSIDGSGNLYIADLYNYKVRFISNNGISTIAGNGLEGFSGDGGSAVNAELNQAVDVAVDSSGNVSIADTGNQRIRQFTVGGNIATMSGGGSGGDNGTATKAVLAGDTTVAWDPSGKNLYIADAANNRIRKISGQSGSTIVTVAGNGNAGYSGDKGPALKATLNSPNGVAVDSSGNIFIADSNNLVVRRVSAKTGSITTYAGNGIACLPRLGKCGDGGKAINANLNDPNALALDSKGNLFIADWVGCRIRKVDTQGVISTTAGTGDCGYTGDGGPGNKAHINYPFGVAVDSADNVYIADSENNVIRCVRGKANGCGAKGAVGTIMTYAFNGQRAFGGDGGPALKASMQLPLEVAVDAADNLYVGGGVDEVVRRIDATNHTVSTVAGNPNNPTQTGFSGDGGPATQAVMQNEGLSVNASEVLMIADTGNNRVRQVDMVPAVKVLTPVVYFGNEPVGKTSAPKTGEIKNVGLATLSITKYQIQGKNPNDFAIEKNGCGSHLSPDLFCKVQITFTPKAKGARNADLLITDDAGQQQIKLVGTGQ